ncbi:MAG: cytochrome c3 family protein [Candidatus Marinimicrobia bacterium]|nr:cytochrome c3 family protein [Candidatus Neomarinimicrobiota bacterium]MBL7031453.1 cytochrome c3 family protein [Candidatus Neomarinimicrobiota bacterium]
MKHWLISLFFAFSAVLIADDSCITCHIELDEDRDENNKIVAQYLLGVHAEKNIGCADCHGGDPEAFDDEDEAMWDVDSFMADLEKQDQLEMCGKCHSDPEYMRMFSASIKTDQVDQYLTSGHGKALSKGMEKAAVCSDCHGVHGILPVKDPRASVYGFNIPKTCAQCHTDPYYMKGTGLPTDQFDQYRNSVHGKALFDKEDIGAPACNDCHGNHGAAPPDVVHVSDICGTCHINNRNLFQNSHLKQALMEEGLGQCEACHDNHGVIKPNDSFLDWDNNSLCIECHQDGGDAKLMADKFYGIIDSLKQKITHANEIVDKAEQKGMVISDLLFHLEDARKVLIHTRTNIHSFNTIYVDTNATPGFIAAQATIAGAEAGLDEFDYRRTGLFFFSLIITFLVIVLGKKARQLTKR